MASMSTQRASSSSSLSSSSSSSPVIPQWTYEVFLSFRGDTRNGFTSHMYTALKQNGILTFKDDEKLKRGKSISPELLKAIEESRCAIVILSKNYASSTWCLDELAKAIQCMKKMGMIVLPVFYNVEPSDVRKQSGPFAQAFDEYEKHFKEKVQTWRDALREVANLSGWHLQNRSESELIQNIVKTISHNLSPTFFVDKKGLVGINSRAEKLKSRLAIGSNDVRMIGIKGMGGIGKTALARAVYNMISFQFEAHSFIANVREESEKCGLPQLQQNLLKELLMETEVNIQNVENGALMMKQRLHDKKILLVLDDVNHLDQLKNLAGEHNWFGPGSRVIITTRDEHLLMVHEVDDTYEAKGLNYDEALHLFNLKAFGKDHPAECYLELSQEFVHYADGLPLAIEVLGSSLFNKRIDEWKSALRRLKEFPERKIINVLQTSFEELHETVKDIFLDIACFFNHKNKDYVEEILEYLGLFPKIGLSELVDKSLLKLHEDQLWMHDLLVEMGRDIVRQECPQDPGKRSRLLSFKDIDYVLTNNTGTGSIQSIFLELNEPKEARWNSEGLSKMYGLRLLKMHNVHLSHGITCLPNDLRILDWSYYPSKSLPSEFCPKEIVEIRMPHSNIQRLWNETKYLDKLKLIEVNYCVDLIETVDITGIPNLEKLVVEGCLNLCMVHPSLEVHKRLTFLSFRGCKNLINLPRTFEMPSLEILILSGCSKIKKIPEFVGSMKHVLKLYLDGTAITELPKTVGNLIGLVSLNLRDCKDLMSLPVTLFNLKSLEDLNLSGCSKLENLPENLGNAISIVKLDASRTALRRVPFSCGLLKNLRNLSVCGCKGLSSSHESRYDIPFYSVSGSSDPMDTLLSSLSGSCSVTRLDLSNCNLQAIPNEIGCLFSLVDLNLSGNNFDCIPECIIRLSNLEFIFLENCTSLLTLPMFPLNISYIWASNCTSLETLPDKLKPNDSFEPSLHLLNCLNLADNQGLIHILFAMLKALSLQGLRRQYPLGRYNLVIPGSVIPKWFCHQSMGDEVSVQEPSYLHKDEEWVGIAVCTVFFSHNHHQHDQIIDHRELGCHLIANGNHIYPLPGISDIAKVLSDHIWLLYLFPEHYDRRSINLLFESDANGFNQIGIRIETKGSGLRVKKCGFRLVYMNDIEDLNQTMGQSSNNSEGTKVRVPFGMQEIHDGARPSEEDSFNSQTDCEESSEYEDCGEEFSDCD